MRFRIEPKTRKGAAQVLKAAITCAFLGLAVSCGSPQTGEGSVDITDPALVAQKRTDLEILATQYANDIPRDHIMLVDLDDKTTYTEKSGLRRLDLRPSKNRHEVLAQEAPVVEVRRIPTKYGTSLRPFTKIQARLRLPSEDELQWLNDNPGDAVFNHFGFQTRQGLALDVGLTSETLTPGRQAGRWYSFLTPPGAQLGDFPPGGLPGGATYLMSVEAVPDAKPSVPGESPGVVLSVKQSLGFAIFSAGGNVGNINVAGIDQSVRLVTSIDAASGNEDARMCGTRWSDVMVGTADDLVPFTEELGAEPDGNLLPIEKTGGVVVRNQTKYTAETIDIGCSNSVALVIDDTGSMGPELLALKLALELFITSGVADLVGNIKSWTLVTFKDFVRTVGTTDVVDVILDWVRDLRASGGSSCPEQALGALSVAADILASDENAISRSIVFATDASPSSGDVDGLIAKLRADKVTVHVFLTGDCVSGPVDGFTGRTTAAAATGPLSSRVVFRQIADATGGKFFYLPGATVDDYTLALTEIFETVAEGADDLEPPTLSLVPEPAELWPPNHKMVEVSVAISVQDDQDPDPTVELLGIEVNEPEDQEGSGNTSPDYEITADGKIFLRAERSGTGNRRVYSIIYRATDASGNFTTSSADVVVPHDKGK